MLEDLGKGNKVVRTFCFSDLNIEKNIWFWWFLYTIFEGIILIHYNVFLEKSVFNVWKKYFSVFNKNKDIICTFRRNLEILDGLDCCYLLYLSYDREDLTIFNLKSLIGNIGIEHYSGLEHKKSLTVVWKISFFLFKEIPNGFWLGIVITFVFQYNQ